MLPKVAIIYNEPSPSRYDAMGEGTAVHGVLDEVNAVEQALVEAQYPLLRVSLHPPLEQVNDVTFTQTILERVLHSGDLLIESVGTQGQSKFSNIPEPEEFHSLLYKVREDRSMALQGVRHVPPANDSVSQLERLARLHEEGKISAEEYAELKKKILGGP